MADDAQPWRPFHDRIEHAKDQRERERFDPQDYYDYYAQRVEKPDLTASQSPVADATRQQRATERVEQEAQVQDHQERRIDAMENDPERRALELQETYDHSRFLFGRGVMGAKEVLDDAAKRLEEHLRQHPDLVVEQAYWREQLEELERRAQEARAIDYLFASLEQQSAQYDDHDRER